MKPHVRCTNLAALALMIVSLLASSLLATELQQIAKLVASDGETDDLFAWGVDVDGSVAVCGARGDENGAAFIYRFDGSAWIEEQKLEIGEANAAFGYAVAVQDDVVAVSAPFGNSGTGAVYVYRYDGSTWIEEQMLTASDASSNDEFGFSIAMDDDALLVGAFADEDERGAAYVFRFDGSNWIEEQKLTSSDGIDSDLFGSSVTLDGNLAIVGAPGNDFELGAAYLFRYDGSTWSEEQKITASDGIGEFEFGRATGASGDWVIVSSTFADSGEGAAYAYSFDGATWSEQQKIVRPGSGPSAFGQSIAMHGTRAIITAGSGFIGGGIGAGYVFDLFGSVWNPSDTLLAADGENGDVFGRSVGFDGDVAIISAIRESDQGAAYLFFGARCLDGSVNAGNGLVTSQLYVDGSSGGSDHTVEIRQGDWIPVSVVKPLTGGNGRFVLHADFGTPELLTQAVLPFDVGTSCFPFLLHTGASPVIVANNVGKAGLVGESSYFGIPVEDPASATTTIVYPEMPFGTTLTFQAILIDPGSQSPKGASTTNAVVLTVLP